ncbi:serine hydrolase [Paraburkholderia sp. C35]|uniref:serine hydrolase domain-containing protein n=1 Tax=Paraburkholderia sp. C35 TaxID=2126993 RepID=UPI000D694AE2|nr:serine hydrolase [Paraburkholderia sp. C35]
MKDAIIPIEMLLATTAKVLCSAVFISGRDPEEAFRNSAPWALHAFQLPEALTEIARWKVDGAARRVEVSVTLGDSQVRTLIDSHCSAHPEFDADWTAEATRLKSLGTVTRTAQYTGDQGTIIMPEDGQLHLHFSPIDVARRQTDSGEWLVDPSNEGTKVSESMKQEVEYALCDAFADRTAQHAAVVVVKHGRIVGEMYADSIHRDMPLESWSMGKSVLCTFIGLLVQDGKLSLDDPAPIPAWRDSGDDRRNITLRHLLNMSSGLKCEGAEEPRTAWSTGVPEHFYPYASAINVEDFATQRPSEFPPATVGRYRNCDTLSLSAIYFNTIRTLGLDPLSWPQSNLFDRIGMRGLIHETDRWGRFIISGFNYGTARDWARLGQLYLQDGNWNGTQVLSNEWVQFVRTPAPAWAKQNYGAQFLLNTTREFCLPNDAFFMAGGGGQHVFIVPSLDLVVVRMGHARGYAASKTNVDGLLQGVLRALHT